MTAPTVGQIVRTCHYVALDEKWALPLDTECEVLGAGPLFNSWRLRALEGEFTAAQFVADRSDFRP